MSVSTPEQAWGHRWRSSTWFIVTAMAVALFTDTFLANFIVPILPYMIENRVGLDPSQTQTTSSWLLAESAAVSVIIRVPLAHFADKSASKRNWLLWALVIALVSTASTALGSSLFTLFAARLVQAVADSIMWVVGVATVAESVPLQHIGKIYAIVFMAASAGVSVGPMISGVLFQLGGYWAAWSSAFAIIGVDIIFRLLMIEKPIHEKAGALNNTEINMDMSEEAPFLGSQNDEPDFTPGPKTAPNYYKCIFRKRRFIGGLYCTFMYGLLDTTFTATLPLHVREAFHWGGMVSGLMFACLQAPRMLISPFVGWLKDRVGTRAPTVFAFAILAPLVWFLGVPGNEQFPWASKNDRGTSLYVLAVTLIGIQSTFLNGAGTIEATVAVTELEREHPKAFGPNGGKSRALAIAGIAWNFGTFAGPILAGTLNNEFGYYVMNCVVAATCTCSAIVAFICLHSKMDLSTPSR